mmetsp:Transcript_25511/g.38082  ORF Transcript_25511/g.38082 Transcript_25511/m.38082 type:complete len:203 (+) Transcript_25511:1158-1766(+)
MRTGSSWACFPMSFAPIMLGTSTILIPSPVCPFPVSAWRIITRRTASRVKRAPTRMPMWMKITRTPMISRRFARICTWSLLNVRLIWELVRILDSTTNTAPAICPKWHVPLSRMLSRVRTMRRVRFTSICQNIMLRRVTTRSQMLWLLEHKHFSWLLLFLVPLVCWVTHPCCTRRLSRWAARMLVLSRPRAVRCRKVYSRCV